MNPRPVILQNSMKNKGDPLCYKVELIERNSKFSHVHFKDGEECTVSTKVLALEPCQDSISDSNGLKTFVSITTTLKKRFLPILMNSNLKLLQTLLFPMNCKMQQQKYDKITKCYLNQQHPIQDIN